MKIVLTFSDGNRLDADGWSCEGERFTTDRNLELLKAVLEGGRFLVAEHWHYRGARAPDRFVVEDFDDFVEYLTEHALAGDAVDVYDISDAWKRRGDPIVSGKCPDRKGEVPKGGAY